MGIPFYFKKLTSDFSDILSINIPSGQCNRLFLDFNCGIHFCIGKIREENNKCSHTTFEDILLKKCALLIEELLDHTKPTQLVYISIDGLPPMAKITQQRKRRYFSDWRKRQLLETFKDDDQKLHRELKHEWNSNLVTPGTKFMDRLMLHLQTFCDNYNKQEGDHPIIILSPYKEKGEGEHKICHYIRQHDCHPNCIDVIYGLDADMILLGMLSNNSHNTYLLREAMFYKMKTNDNKQAKYLYLDLNRTTMCICEQWSTLLNTPIPSTPKEQKFIIKCYVVLTFLLGNDFLPNLSYLTLRGNGLETLLTTYKSTFDILNCHILCNNNNNNNNELNIIFLTHLLETLSQNEDIAFEQVEDDYFQRSPPNILSMIPVDKRNSFSFESKKLDFYPIFHKAPFKLFKDKMQSWRTNYYHYLFHHDANNNPITDVCSNYIHGLVWCCDYYFKQHTNWAWFYRHNYSPTILDVSNYICCLEHIPQFTSNTIGYNDDYVSISEQLLMVIPPSSKFIIPDNEHKKYMSHIHKGLVHNFPSDFKVVTYLKSQLHECYPQGVNLSEKITIQTPI